MRQHLVAHCLAGLILTPSEVRVVTSLPCKLAFSFPLCGLPARPQGPASREQASGANRDHRGPHSVL